MSQHFFLVAGEQSGDQLGAQLMANLQSMEPTIRFSGIGGPQMSQAGLLSLFDYRELSVMGIAEVLPRLPALLSRIKTTADAVITSGADALITIDSPDFSLRLASRVRKAKPEIAIIHYVSPTVWAWRAGRTQKMRQVFDLVLTLFPFESEFLHAAGIAATFVGHPIADFPSPTDAERQSIRRLYGLDTDTPILLFLPGSRISEVQRLAPRFAIALGRFIAKNPQYQVILPAAEQVHEWLTEEANKWSFNCLIFSPDVNSKVAMQQKLALFSLADMALAASGTVTLELAATQTPTVAAYDTHFLSRVIISALLRVQSVTLPNLILGKEVIPELLGRRCRPELIVTELNRLSSDEQAKSDQVTAFEGMLHRLQTPSGNSSQAAAQAVMEQVAVHHAGM